MKKLVITYIGRVEGTNNYLVHKYIDENGKSLCFKSKIKDFPIGSKIEVEETETGIKGPYTLIGKETEEKVRKWTNRDKAEYYEYMLNAKLKKKLPEAQDDAIRVLRKSYRELSGVHRQLFINLIIHEIVKY
jgi:hypothetical protein